MLNLKRNHSALKNMYLPFLLITVVTLAVYSNTFHSSFHFDDQRNILANYKITSLSVFWPPSGNRYIGDVSFALNYAFGKDNVAGYHMVNILVHVINGLLVWLLVRLTFDILGQRFSSSNDSLKTKLPLVTALIFAVHPVQTQAVTYIVQRYASLATLFFLLSLYFYIRFRLSTVESTNRYKSFAFYGGSLLSAVLAMKTKEISFTLPFLIILYEIIFPGSGGKNSADRSNTGLFRILKYTAPFLLTIPIIPLTIISPETILTNPLEGIKMATVETATLSRSSYFLTQIRIIVTYLRLLFFPFNQNLDYDYPLFKPGCDTFSEECIGIFEVFSSLVFLCIILVFAVRMCISGNISKGKGGEETGYADSKVCLKLFISFGIFWFFITLSVESSIIPIKDLLFEHRLYLPGFGAFTAIASTYLYYEESLKRRSVLRKRLYYTFLIGFIVLPGITAFHRNTIWKDDLTLYLDIVKKSPANPRGHLGLGTAYQHIGNLRKAEDAYKTAISLNPEFTKAYNNLAALYQKVGDKDDELIKSLYLKAIELSPRYHVSHLNLGVFYYNNGETDKAIEKLEKAISLESKYFESHYMLGIAYEKKELLNSALQEYLLAVQINPDHAESRNNTGKIYSLLNKNEDALREFTRALTLNPDFPEAHYNISLQYDLLGEIDLALSHLNKAVTLRPGFAAAHNNLGIAYSKQGLLEAAITEYRKAAKVSHDPGFYYNLAYALKRAGNTSESKRVYSKFLELKGERK